MLNVLSLYGLLALSAGVLAETQPNPDFDPIYVPARDQKVQAGTVLRITWQAKSDFINDLVSLKLIGGSQQNTQTQVGSGPFAEHIPNSQQYYDWHVDPSLGDRAVYGLVITSESKTDVFQYSNPFSIVGEKKAEPANSDKTRLTTTAIQTKTLHLSSLSPSSPAISESPSISAPVKNATASSPVPSSSCNCTTVVRTRPVSSMVIISSGSPAAPTSYIRASSSAPAPAASSNTASRAADAGANSPNVPIAAATTPMVKTGSLALLLGLVLVLLA